MTISTSTRTAGPFLGNGVTTVLPFTFKVFAATDLVLTGTSSTGIDTTLVLGTHYTVTLNANQDVSPGGNVTMLTAPPTGEKTTVVSAVPDTQTNVFTVGGAWSPTVMNSALDKLTILELQGKANVSRALKIPSSDGSINTELPTAAIRANSIMAFDSAGYPILISQPSGTSINYPNVQGPSGSSLVGFTQSGTGAVTRTVQEKERDTVSFKDFGAVGDGVTDDRAAIVAALGSGALVVDGGGLTYKISANISLTSSNLTIQNAKFNAASIVTGGSLFTFSGAQSAGVSLTSNTAVGSNSIAIGNTTGFAADGYAFIYSNAIFDSTDAVTLGQIVKVKSVDSGVAMTLNSDVIYNFNTADSAAIAKITPLSSIRFTNVEFTGASTGIQSALAFSKCSEVSIDLCKFDYFDYASIIFDRCVNAEVSSTALRYARAVGLSYGISIGNGCYNVRISNCYAEDQRHFVTIGDNDGVNLFVSVTNCHAAHQRDAGLDSHPAGDFVLFNGNTIECVAAQSDGIIFQGLNCIISNNIIIGNITCGIRHQILPEIGTGSCVISGNTIENTGGTASTDTAIYVAQESASGAELHGVVISGNRVDGAIEQGIYVYANSGNIKGVTISGNILTSDATGFACSIRANSTFSVDGFTITGNILKCTGSHGVDLFGATSPNVLNGTLSGNIITGGTNGIRITYGANITEVGNSITGGTGRVLINTGTTGAILDRKKSTISTATNSTYAVTDQDEYIIANRAATITVTLPDPVAWAGRELTIKTIQAQLVVSAASDVAPITDTVLGTAILPASDGAWAMLKSNGTGWVIMQKG